MALGRGPVAGARLIGLWLACAAPVPPAALPHPQTVPADRGHVLLHRSGPVFQAPREDGPRGRLGVARSPDFPAEIWPARVLGVQSGWLQVQAVAAAQAAVHWADPPPVLQALGLTVWVPEDAALAVVTRPVIQSWLDGSTIALGPGTPLSGSTALVRAGDATLSVVAHPELDERGFGYEPGGLTPARAPVGWLGVDPALAFGTVGGVPLTRVPRAGRSRPVTRIPLEEQATDGTHHWGILGSRTARVRTLLDHARVREGRGWGHVAARPEPAAAYDGWWRVAAGTPVSWPDASPAGRVAEPVRWDVAPVPTGDLLCTWWQDLVGSHEAAGITARWSAHASVLAETGLRICFPAEAVGYSPSSP